MERQKIKRPKTVSKIEKKSESRDHIQEAFDDAVWRIEMLNEPVSYSDIKYCIPEFLQWGQEQMASDSVSSERKKVISTVIDEINDEQKRLKEIILSNMRQSSVRIEKDDVLHSDSAPATIDSIIVQAREKSREEKTSHSSSGPKYSNDIR